MWHKYWCIIYFLDLLFFSNILLNFGSIQKIFYYQICSPTNFFKFCSVLNMFHWLIFFILLWMNEKMELKVTLKLYMYIYCKTIINLTWFIFLGNFDALLQWPFSFRVTFMLLDQNNKEHQVDSFRPDPNSSSFKRPTTEMNIASGCPLFIPLAKLDDPSLAYVKEDTMFIKLVVDVPRGWFFIPSL